MSSTYTPYHTPANDDIMQEEQVHGFDLQSLINATITYSSPENLPDMVPVDAQQLEHPQIRTGGHNSTYIQERHWIQQTTIRNELIVDQHGRETWIARPIETKWIENNALNVPGDQREAQSLPVLAGSSSIIHSGSPSMDNDQAIQHSQLAQANSNISKHAQLSYSLIMNDSENIVALEGMLLNESIAQDQDTVPIEDTSLRFTQQGMDHYIFN